MNKLLPMVFVDSIDIEDSPQHKITLLKVESGKDNLIELVLPEVLLTELYLKLKGLYRDHNQLYTKAQIKEHLEKMLQRLKDVIAQDNTDSKDILKSFYDMNEALLKEESEL